MLETWTKLLLGLSCKKLLELAHVLEPEPAQELVLA